MGEQLEMLRPHLCDLPEPRCPKGYAVRTFRPGDEAAWARIFEGSLGDNWSAELIRERMINQPGFQPSSTFFVTWRGTPVGAASAWLRKPIEEGEGYVHMVAVRPEHRGRRLGELLTLLTLYRFREMGLTSARLHTDDWRLPAIAIYLDLGFEPVIRDESHQARWAEVLKKLGRTRQTVGGRLG